MPVMRLTFILVVIAVIVLLASYYITNNPSYLQLIRQVLKYVGLLLVIALLLYLIERIIRL